MGSRNVLLAIAESPRTVFTLQSLMMLTGIYDRRSLVNSLYYYKRKGYIRSPRSGIFVKPEYDEKELAGAIYDFSYISLQYVLARAGVVFQYSEAVTCVSTMSRTLLVDGKEYRYRKINPILWSNRNGIIQKDGYCMATPERALLDVMYLFPDIRYFDRTDNLDKEKLLELSKEYDNKRLENSIKEIYG